MNGGRKRARLILLGVIFSLHCALILGPLGFNALMQQRNRQKPIAFRVKLGGFEPSHAPEAGIPERKRPAPEAARPPKAKPTPPRPAPEKPKAAIKKTKPIPKKKTVRKKPRQKPVKRKVLPKRTVKKTTRKIQKKTVRKQKKPEVFHDSRWDNFDPNKVSPPAGGRNFNRNVQIGSRDRGQKIGKADHRTPAGGATADEEKYAHNLVGFIREKWDRPPGILVDETVAVTIELTISADGRVTGKRILKPSPNPAVNNSAMELLKKLSIVPRPPNGGTTLAYSLVSE